MIPCQNTIERWSKEYLRESNLQKQQMSRLQGMFREVRLVSRVSGRTNATSHFSLGFVGVLGHRVAILEGAGEDALRRPWTNKSCCALC